MHASQEEHGDSTFVSVILKAKCFISIRPTPDELLCFLTPGIDYEDYEVA